VAVLVALTYGLRRGEVLGLHWSALDWRAGTVVVTHGVKRIKARDATSPYRTQLVIAELKTPRSRRTLALTAELQAALRQHHARQAEARIAAGALWQDHGLIFTTEIGTPDRLGKLRPYLFPAVQEGGARPLAPARAASFRRVVDAGPGHTAARRLGSPRAR